MSWLKNITDPSEVVKKGDEVDAVVLAMQKEEGKISLGMKQTEKNPWDTLPEISSWHQIERRGQELDQLRRFCRT